MNEDEFLTEVAELIGIRNDNEMPIIEEEANIQENREGMNSRSNSKVRSKETVNNNKYTISNDYNCNKLAVHMLFKCLSP